MERAGNTESEALIEASKSLTFARPVGEIAFRSIDHKATIVHTLSALRSLTVRG